MKNNPYAEALRNFLESRRISQEDFGKAIGRDQTTISFFVNGKRFPKRAEADRIDAITEGQVPVTVWKLVALERAGIL